MKPVWVFLIALAALLVGLFLGGVTGLGVGGSGGLAGGAVVGGAFGACSVLEDAVQQQAIDQTQSKQLYARFSSRVGQLLPGFSLEKELPLEKCEESLAKFRAEVNDKKK